MKASSFVRGHPLATYFVLAYAIAWIGSFAAVGPKFIRGDPIQFSDALLMFLPMLAGPSVAGIALTALMEGREGLRDLVARMRKWRVGAGWYSAAVFLFPVLILAVLLALASLVSPKFAPNLAATGVAVGLLAGFFEEIGWTGYAYPRMQSQHGAFAAAVYLGLLHSTWHAAADYLGSSTALGAYWLPHFLVFMTAAMTAARVLIAWVYANTRSVLLAQLMHASSTGFLYVLAPAGLSPAEDTLWYAAYAATLWIAVAVVVLRYGRQLVEPAARSPG